MIGIRNTHGNYVEMRKNSKGNYFSHPIFFNPFCKLTSWQNKQQPTLFMSVQDWEYISDPDVTHEGAFGEDYQEWNEETVSERWVSGYDPRGTSWVIVWKFPGDLNHLKDKSGNYVFNKIYNVPLPVGMYSMYDDGWTKHIVKSQSHPNFPKNSTAEKIRIDFTSGNGVHYLENKYEYQVAMIGSHYFIEEFWKVKSSEKKRVISLIQKLYEIGIYAFPCYSQHHAIVFYMHNNVLITPEELVKLLSSNKEFVTILQDHSMFSIKSWISNYIKVVTSNLLNSFKNSPPKLLKENSDKKSKKYAIHKQPDPTGSLVRKVASKDSEWVSNIPVPNNVQVTVKKESNEFTLIKYKKIEGWIRTKYLTM